MLAILIRPQCVQHMETRYNGCHFADIIFKFVFFCANCLILIHVSLKYNPTGPMNNNPAFIEIMPWHQTGNKSLSEPMMA